MGLNFKFVLLSLMGHLAVVTHANTHTHTYTLPVQRASTAADWLGIVPIRFRGGTLTRFTSSDMMLSYFIYFFLPFDPIR